MVARQACSSASQLVLAWPGRPSLLFSSFSQSCQRSSASAVIVVQSTQDWEGEDLATIVIWRDRLTIPFWNLLFDALMRSGSIEVLDIGMQDTMQLLLLEDEKVIETLSTHAAQKPFADRIGSWCMVRRFGDADAQLEEFATDPFRSEDADSAPPFP